AQVYPGALKCISGVSQVYLRCIFGVSQEPPGAHRYISGISQVYLRCISGVSQVYLRCIPGVSQVYPRCIPGVSQVYLRCISGVSQVYPRCISGISQVYLRCISGVSRVYPGCIPGVSQVYLRCIPGVFQVYLRCISGVSQVYPRCISGVSQVYPRCISGVSRVYLRSPQVSAGFPAGAGAGAAVHPAEPGAVAALHRPAAELAGPRAARERPARARGVRGGAGGGRDGFPLGQTLGILRGVGAGARRPAGGHGHLRPPAVHAHAALQPPLGEVGTPGIPWGNTGKTPGIPWGNTGNSVGKQWGNTGNSLGKHWEFPGETPGIPWGNTGKTPGIPWGNTGNSLGKHREFPGETLGKTPGIPWENTGNSLGKQRGKHRENTGNSLGKEQGRSGEDLDGNSPIPGVNSPILGENSPILIGNSLVLGVNSLIPGLNSPVLIGSSPIPIGNSPFLGANSLFLGANSPFLGVNSPFLGANSPFLGASSPFLGANSPIPGANSPIPVGNSRRFKEHVLQHPPGAILSPEELLWLRSKLGPGPEPAEPPQGPGQEEEPPGAPPEPQEDLDQEKIRELVISMRQQIYAQNEAEVSKRWNFEDGIKRPYFHVKPLERAQLRNWREYLDFEVAAGSHERSIVLFEGCLIACALYEEFWVKYTRYLESRTVPGARSVFQRACGFHLPRKPNIHLLWAAFEEKQGNVDEARRILRSFEAAVPGLAMVRLRRVSLERVTPITPITPFSPIFTHFPPILPHFSGNVDEARRILRSFEAAVPGLAMVRLRRVSLERRHGRVAEAEALLLEAMRANEGLPLGSFYAVKLARQVCKVQKNLGRARKVLVEALEKDPENARLHANLLEMEFGADVGQNEGNTMSCFEQRPAQPPARRGQAALLSSAASSSSRTSAPASTACSRTEQPGGTPKRVWGLPPERCPLPSLLKAYDEHQKILKAHAARKRAPENGSEEPDDKRLRPDDPSGPLGPHNVSGGGDPNPSYSYWYQVGHFGAFWGGALGVSRADPPPLFPPISSRATAPTATRAPGATATTTGRAEEGARPPPPPTLYRLWDPSPKIWGGGAL
uniref:Uncharacterized protein n=1 Tax=Geospiza parvula TaxID=87175 RepID=A0A8C3MM08_GEOPR